MILSEEAIVDSDVKSKISSEIGLTEDRLRKDKESFRRWISYQHHFPATVLEDTFLESFIIGCKGSLERAKTKIDAYFSCRSKYPEIFSKRDTTDKTYIKFANLQPFITLPGRSDEGYRVHVTWLEGAEYDVTLWTKRVLDQWELLLRSDPWSAGEIFLVSGVNFTLSHATKLTTGDVVTMFSLAQNVYPLRLRGVWFFSAPQACDFLVNKILKPVINKKLSDRIQVHSQDYKILSDYFPARILPEDYGGESSSLSLLNENWLSKLTENGNWFINDGSLTTDESKRPPDTKDSFGGVSGSFKKMQID